MSECQYDTVPFSLIYTSFQGLIATASIVRITSGLQTITRHKDPATGLPAWVGWTGRASAAGPEKPISPFIPQSLAPIPQDRPLIRVSATIIKPGTYTPELAALSANKIGIVNSADWFGRPRACWRLDGYNAEIAKYQGYYSLSATATGIGGRQSSFEDWRELTVLEDQRTGRRAVPDPVKMAAAIQAPYAFGLINKDTASGGGIVTIYDPLTDGFRVTGPFDLGNFSTLMGF
jgi:hypothetical protein